VSRGPWGSGLWLAVGIAAVACGDGGPHITPAALERLEDTLTALERELKASERDGVPSPARSTSEDDHDEHTVGYDGRNGNGVEGPDHWSRDDVAEMSDDASSTRQPPPAPAPGSWMKKRA